MEIRQLQHFVSLYRLRSFVQAADEHDVTQSALSRSLKRLESEIGHRLFDRNTHEVEPTAAGEALIGRARDVVDAVQAFSEEATLLAGGVVGHVRIGTGPYPAQPLITRAVSRLAAEHPGIRVSVVAGTSNDLLIALVERKLDFVVCDISKYDDSPSADRISVIKLPSEPLVAVMSSDWELDAIDLERAARLPWAMPTPAPFGARELPQPFVEALATERFPHYRLEATSACLELAKTGHAITLVPRSLALEACREGELQYVEAPEPLRTNDGIHFIRDRSRSSVAQRAIEAILDVAKAQSSPG